MAKPTPENHRGHPQLSAFGLLLSASTGQFLFLKSAARFDTFVHAPLHDLLFDILTNNTRRAIGGPAMPVPKPDGG